MAPAFLISLLRVSRNPYGRDPRVYGSVQHHPTFGGLAARLCLPSRVIRAASPLGTWASSCLPTQTPWLNTV
jgi:hypothetical protein